MSLLVELTDLNEKEQILLIERKHALYFLKVEETASLLRDGGFKVTTKNIAEFANLYEKEVTEAINWFSKGAPGKLPFELDSQQEPVSILARVLAGLAWIDNRRLQRTQGRKTPPIDRSLLGIQKIQQLTGLTLPEISSTIETHKAEVLKKFPDFKPSWVDDDKSVKALNNKNQSFETKIKLIRQATEEISNGVIGRVTAEQLEGWRKGKIGLGKREIDRLLSTRKDLRDLDKYRAKGSFVGLTDADREARYYKSLTQN